MENSVRAFPESSRLAVFRATDIAKRSGSPVVSDVHLVFALLNNPRIASIFLHAGVDIQTFFADFSSGESGEDMDAPTFDESIQAVFDEANKALKGQFGRGLSPEILSLACVRSSASVRERLHLDSSIRENLEQQLLEASATPS